MRILIADDHDLLRDVLRAYLTTEGGFEVALASDLPSALKAVEQEGPFDLMLLDLSMPGMNGFAGLEAAIAASGGCPVALMSGIAPPGAANRALELGASGFLPKTLPARSVMNAIRFMAAGERYAPLDILRGNGAATPHAALGDTLTRRERQVLLGLCRGQSNKEIARDLELSEPTIKLHMKLVCRKLQARNRTHAAMLAKEAGFC